jgi:hypothetical protein
LAIPPFKAITGLRNAMGLITLPKVTRKQRQSKILSLYWMTLPAKGQRGADNRQRSFISMPRVFPGSEKNQNNICRGSGAVEELKERLDR